MGVVHWLGDDDCHDQTLLGGKAASLSRLASRHPVPPGFAVPALPAAEPSLPLPLVSAIRTAYTALGERCGQEELAVAVRSSAIDEDGRDASFAGQHDTFLNVRGGDAVTQAVLGCVRSAASAEALAYRKQRGIPMDDLRIAVLVQELVASDVSAVVFTANPLTGSRDEVIITSNWGLGASIVSGTVTPDTFVVGKSGLVISHREVATKRHMTVLTDTGTAEVDVPATLQMAASLNDEQIREMAHLAVVLEEELGHPVDVECAIAGSVLYLLQCRPITTLG